MEQLNTFANIPIKVIDTHPVDPLALAKTLLCEIIAKLGHLIESGQGDVIDLRALPSLGEEGYQFLKEQLGRGEVTAQIQGFGRSVIHETSFTGIWWISHYNQDDDIYTEQIEVSFLPDILKSHKEDAVLSQKQLSGLLKALAEKT